MSSRNFQAWLRYDLFCTYATGAVGNFIWKNEASFQASVNVCRRCGKGYTAVKKPTHGANKKAACLHKYNDELLLVYLCIHYKYRNTYIAGKSRSS